jgi:hypothetical protein
MTTDLNVLRQNMIENMIKFLADDCYIYIMTTGLDKYKTNVDKNDFYTFQMNLSSAFHTTIKDIYKAMGSEDPSNQVNKMYADVVSKTIERIQEENHPFSIGMNVNQGMVYEIVFLKNTKTTPE